MIRRTLKFAAPALLLLANAQPAHAHIVSIRLGDFYAGALHPLTDLQDVLLWSALGILAGALGAAKGRWLVLVFPLGLVAGVVAAGSIGPSAGNAALTACLILLLGLLLASAIRIPLSALCVIAFAIAATRGAANASELAPASDRLLFAAGLASAGYVTITLIMALTVAFKPNETAAPWRGIAIRSLGGWISAIGLMMAGLAFVA